MTTTTTATKKKAHHMPALKIPSTTVQPLNKKTTAIEIAGNDFCLPIPIVYMIGFNYCTIPGCIKGGLFP